MYAVSCKESGGRLRTGIKVLKIKSKLLRQKVTNKKTKGKPGLRPTVGKKIGTITNYGNSTALIKFSNTNSSRVLELLCETGGNAGDARGFGELSVKRKGGEKSD